MQNAVAIAVIMIIANISPKNVANIIWVSTSETANIQHHRNHRDHHRGRCWHGGRRRRHPTLVHQSP